MKIYNHIATKLCQHEADMVPHIPQGGNWKNIPNSISDNRLKGIRNAGSGRTTYYGRLSWDKPSYTIATFFNRVPNGCNIHPDQDRILSFREAARLQSFPDDFIFLGTKASQCKQIGNAVPPLLARYVASLIKPHLTSYNFVDLFAGCGGLSEGFIMDGYKLIAANEYDAHIFSTNKFNHSKYAKDENFILGDITKDEVKNALFKCCENHKIDIIVGGPPCQGFSYAGWRDPDDERNQLFREFVTIVLKLKPKFFVMENVPGILTMKGGETYNDIVKAFTEIGYTMSAPLKLKAENFGVPQKRRRVFLIGSLDPSIEIKSTDVLFSDEDMFLPNPITVKDAIGSFPELNDGEGEDEIEYEFTTESLYDKLMQKKISFDEFYKMCLKK
jgi:DNA (cytosine-5)-methyltransferase 1